MLVSAFSSFFTHDSRPGSAIHPLSFQVSFLLLLLLPPLSLSRRRFLRSQIPPTFASSFAALAKQVRSDDDKEDDQEDEAGTRESEEEDGRTERGSKCSYHQVNASGAPNPESSQSTFSLSRSLQRDCSISRSRTNRVEWTERSRRGTLAASSLPRPGECCR